MREIITGFGFGYVCLQTYSMLLLYSCLFFYLFSKMAVTNLNHETYRRIHVMFPAEEWNSTGELLTLNRELAK